MSGACLADGSSITHARRGHECSFCRRTVFGNDGKVSHARCHVRDGEAVALEKYYGARQHRTSTAGRSCPSARPNGSRNGFPAATGSSNPDRDWRAARETDGGAS